MGPGWGHQTWEGVENRSSNWAFVPGWRGPSFEKPVCLSELFTSLLSIGGDLQVFLQLVFLLIPTPGYRVVITAAQIPSPSNLELTETPVQSTFALDSILFLCYHIKNIWSWLGRGEGSFGVKAHAFCCLMYI